MPEDNVRYALQATHPGTAICGPLTGMLQHPNGSLILFLSEKEAQIEAKRWEKKAVGFSFKVVIAPYSGETQ